MPSIIVIGLGVMAAAVVYDKCFYDRVHRIEPRPGYRMQPGKPADRAAAIERDARRAARPDGLGVDHDPNEVTK